MNDRELLNYLSALMEIRAADLEVISKRRPAIAVTAATVIVEDVRHAIDQWTERLAGLADSNSAEGREALVMLETGAKLMQIQGDLERRFLL